MDALFPDELTEDDQALIAQALRRQQDAGNIALLSGIRSLQPFGQSALQGAQHQRELLAQGRQQSLQRQLNLAKMVADAREKAIDNERAERGLQERTEQDIFMRAHPNQTVVQVTPPGAPPGAPPKLATFNPRTGKIEETEYSGPSKGGAPGASDKLKENLLAALGKDLDATSGRSNLAANQQKQLEAAERLETLLNAPGPFNTERLGEAITMAATIANAGAVPTESQREMLLPHTARGNIAKWLEFVTNNPQDAGAQEFVKLLRQQSEREKATAGAQMRRTMLGRLVKHQEAFQKYPEEAGRIAEGARLKGLYDPKTLLPLEQIDPVAEAGTQDKRAALAARIAQLKHDGVTDPVAIKTQLAKEGLLGGH